MDVQPLAHAAVQGGVCTQERGNAEDDACERGQGQMNDQDGLEGICARMLIEVRGWVAGLCVGIWEGRPAQGAGTGL